MEYDQSKKTLEQEYRQRLAEASELQASLREKERELASKEEVIADLQEVVVTQKAKEEQDQRVGEDGLS